MRCHYACMHYEFYLLPLQQHLSPPCLSVSSHLPYFCFLLLVDLSRPLCQTPGYPRQRFFRFGLHFKHNDCCNILVPSSGAYGDTTRWSPAPGLLISTTNKDAANLPERQPTLVASNSPSRRRNYRPSKALPPPIDSSPLPRLPTKLAYSIYQ